jgi:hypothetical protein
MPLSDAKMHRFELPSAVLKRGFWLYLWKIQEGHNTKPIYYVGMTGDTGSYSAQSPINRVSAHLGSNENANALRYYAQQHEIDLEGCHRIEFFAYGPISTVPKITDETSKALYRQERQKVAAIEKAIWLEMQRRGCFLINPCPGCRTSANHAHLAMALEAFSGALNSN